MICAYVRRQAWTGPWLRLPGEPSVVHNVIAIYLEQNVESEAAIFDIPSDLTPPSRFEDGLEPGRLLYQITSHYRRFLKEMAHG